MLTENIHTAPVENKKWHTM